MCEKCVEIDEAIARYKRLRVQIVDQMAARAAEELIVGLEAQKRELHLKK
jgi:hypothetical protein